MKLRDGFILHETSGEHIAVATGKALDYLNGMIRGNETTAFILSLLTSHTERDVILDAMCSRYDAPRERIASDLDGVIAKLRAANLLDE